MRRHGPPDYSDATSRLPLDLRTVAESLPLFFAITLYRAMDMTFWLPQTETALAS